MSFDSTSLIVNVFAGIVGVAYFKYGKKQQKLVPPISGACAAKLSHMHFAIFALVGLFIWGVWRLIRAQIESGGDAQDESAPNSPQDKDVDAGKSDGS